MAGHAQLNFVMTECSKTQIRLTGLNLCVSVVHENSTMTFIALILKREYELRHANLCLRAFRHDKF